VLEVVVLEVGVSVVVVRVTGTTLSSMKVFASVPACTHPVYVTVCTGPPELRVSVLVFVSWAFTAMAVQPRAIANDVMNRLMCSPPIGLPWFLLQPRGQNTLSREVMRPFSGKYRR
jgi:hypothetical protein